jgi:hypothetical protein
VSLLRAGTAAGTEGLCLEKLKSLMSMHMTTSDVDAHEGSELFELNLREPPRDQGAVPLLVQSLILACDRLHLFSC